MIGNSQTQTRNEYQKTTQKRGETLNGSSANKKHGTTATETHERMDNEDIQIIGKLQLSSVRTFGECALHNHRRPKNA